MKQIIKTIAILILACFFSSCVKKILINKPEVKANSWTSLNTLPYKMDSQLDEVVIFNPNSNITSDQYWWYNFKDPVLNNLIDQALKQNLDLKIAEARLKQLRSQMGLSKSLIFPTVGGNINAFEGNATSPIMPRKIDNNKSIESDISISWVLDLFGRSKSYLNMAKAKTRAQIAIQAATRIMIISEVASNYLNLRGAQAQLQIYKENLLLEEKKFDLINVKNKYGLVSSLAKAKAASELAKKYSYLSRVENAVKQYSGNLELLLAKNSGELEAELSAVNFEELPIKPFTFEKIIINTPAEVIRSRPDIIAAEQELQSADALEDYAIASFYPRISLLALFGYQTSQGNLFNSVNAIKANNASLALPILDFNRLKNNLKSSQAYKEEALLKYQKAVLATISEIDGSLFNYLTSLRSYQLMLISYQQDQKASMANQHLYKKGAIGLSENIDNQILLNQSQISIIQSRTDLMNKLILLYKSLGRLY